MRGKTGLISLSGRIIEPGLINDMKDAIFYRDPDDEGDVLIYQDRSRGKWQ
ncbi:MAG: hypothetical protein WD823_01045 [Sulfuricaulis sp.]|uniref:hypothetical protein n=1 Tax=Sulfuricaulis sp. TaxID=2003553 RepID=UPI0034A58A85